LDGNWLALAVPHGSHTIQFRYRPWDVPLGMALSLIGWGMAGWYLAGRKSAAGG
jgi:hypothetical protein